MGREIRRVPENWDHPKNYNGKYKSLLDDYVGDLKYFKENVDSFIEHMIEVIKKGNVKIYSTEYFSSKEVYDYYEEIKAPDINNYMPNGEWYQLFQNVSEGYPLSPPFETKQELIEWLTNNKDYWGNFWGEEGAKYIVNTCHAISGIITEGKCYKPEEQHLIK